MDKRTLGTNGLEVSAIGLGCMSMTGGYSDKPDRQEMISLIGTAVDRGVTFFDHRDPEMVSRIGGRRR